MSHHLRIAMPISALTKRSGLWSLVENYLHGGISDRSKGYFSRPFGVVGCHLEGSGITLGNESIDYVVPKQVLVEVVSIAIRVALDLFFKRDRLTIDDLIANAYQAPIPAQLEHEAEVTAYLGVGTQVTSVHREIILAVDGGYLLPQSHFTSRAFLYVWRPHTTYKQLEQRWEEG